MMKRWLIGSVLFFLLSGLVAAQGLTIEVKKGVRNPTPIAVIPFAWSGAGFNGDLIAEIVSDDLYR
ncbi:MAG TPA: Tol-Pal system protein TolB, partial [Pseudomonadales bacterium]|nr:Tol-Pal system protein TolB [Pseudomonadales bacterium]